MRVGKSDRIEERRLARDADEGLERREDARFPVRADVARAAALVEPRVYGRRLGRRVRRRHVAAVRDAGGHLSALWTPRLAMRIALSGHSHCEY
eukprot:SAG11_NODE_1887_length_4116_cov_8.004730_2_plen_94_part_00